MSTLTALTVNGSVDGGVDSLASPSQKVSYLMPPLDKLKHRKLAAVLRKLLQKLEATWLKHFACLMVAVSTVIK